ncbi:MAG: hypothetical protein H7173_13525 [Rhodoferax sp.]|nr:hypothetical protein [Pseudorhodobacter sp.]
MRVGGLILVLVLPLLVACKILPAALDAPPPSATGQDGISETALADGEGKSAGVGIRPRPRPAPATLGQDATLAPTADAPPPAEVAPVVQKSTEQITCEKRGGNWGSAGKSNLKTCIKRTRDAGKQCRKQGDCTSVCLARSGTCAPVKPLFGCNEIFQKDGSRVTLCLD